MEQQDEQQQERVELPAEIQQLRDEMVKTVAIFEQAGQAQAQAIGQLATTLLTVQYQLIKALTDIEIIKKERNEQ